jgi:hypothetical protein
MAAIWTGAFAVNVSTIAIDCSKAVSEHGFSSGESRVAVYAGLASFISAGSAMFSGLRVIGLGSEIATLSAAETTQAQIAPITPEQSQKQ